MGTKTIGLDEEAYERLSAEKREDESFSDVVKRLTDEVAADWRHGFGTLDEETADRIREVVAAQREDSGEGLAERQQAALDAMTESERDDR